MMCLRLFAPAALGAVLAGCLSHPQPRHIYSLEGEVDQPTQVEDSPERRVLRLQHVLIPDYLDTTDILSREGPHEVHESSTGRFAERLSWGITRALRTDLAARLPQYSIALTPAAGAPARQILVNVDQLDIRPNGRCVLIADWSLVGADHRTLLAADRGSFSAGAAAVGSGDSAIVTAIADAVRQLADRVAVTAGATGGI